MRLLLIVLTIVVVLAAGMAVLVWSGVYNIAASEPHSAFVHWLFATVRDRSIVSRSQSSDVPNLTDPDHVRAGIRSYQAMCRVCHGRPGEESPPIREGLNPQAPKLDSERIRKRTDAELFWVIKNGIRMTGMPAFARPTRIKISGRSLRLSATFRICARMTMPPWSKRPEQNKLSRGPSTNTKFEQWRVRQV